jgi:hypothetical protein
MNTWPQRLTTNDIWPHYLTAKQLDEMHSCAVKCPFCGRPYKVGMEGFWCPDTVHCGHYTWCLPDEAAPFEQVAA